MIASAVSQGGTHHVFWVGTDKQTVHYRYQGSAETAWHDGGVFASSDPKNIAGISASLSRAGNLEVFVRYEDGSVGHTWQRPNSTDWNGGQPGKQVAAFTPLPG